jgi:CrcB protein
MTQFLVVFVGGGIGAALRWQCQQALNLPQQWPWGTLLVNIVGGLIAGCCLALADRLSADTRLFFVTGILGGLTTFSAMSYEMVAMIHCGDILTALIYGTISLIIATSLCWLGFSLTARFALQS